MIGTSSVLAVIPARGGSKRVPRKNLRDVGGQPLLHWTIAAARQSRYIDRLILSSEDEEIQQAARSLGCEVPFSRPAELAADTTPGIDPVLHALEQLSGYEWVVLLQPTSPLRITSDIDRCVELCVERSAPACVSMMPVEKSPDWYYRIGDGGEMSKWLSPEQAAAAQGLHVLNGAVYVARCEWLTRSRTFIDQETIAYVMPAARSVDIDSEADLELAAALLELRR